MVVVHPSPGCRYQDIPHGFHRLVYCPHHGARVPGLGPFSPGHSAIFPVDDEQEPGYSHVLDQCVNPHGAAQDGGATRGIL